jgi:putative transposase
LPEVKKILVSLEVAAQLESMDYHTLYRKIQRNSDKYIIHTEPAENGGKERILVEMSSLSKRAILTYQTIKNMDIKSTTEEVVSQDGDDDEAWYVGIELNKYIQKHSDNFYKAVELANRIKEFLEYDGDNKTLYTEQCASKLEMSARNFRRKVDKYLEGSAWALEMSSYDGKNYDFYKILALCRMPREQKPIALTDEIMAIIENIWYDKRFSQNRRFQSKLYIMLQKMAEQNGWVYIPSYQTVNRYINYITHKYSSEKYLASQGMKELKRSKMIKRRRNTSMLKVMELVQGDGHTFDCWVKLTRPNGYVTAIRPVLVGLIDIRSRCLVGWAVCEVPDSQVIKQVMLHMMYPKKNNPIEGVPRVLLIDNGKDWTAQTLTGRPRKVRFALDSETVGFYKSIGIEDDMRSLPYQAWTKAQIERFFGTICNDFTSEFDSYTGTLTGSKTISKIKKNIKKMLENNELLSMEEFAAKFDNYINKDYHTRVHGGLKDQKEENPRPIEVFLNAEKYYKAAPPMEYSRVLLMKCEQRMVYTVGIEAFNRHFQHEDLAPYINTYVDIRYDLNNLDRIFVYNKDGSKVCEIDSYEGLNPIASSDDQELISHIKEQNRQISRIKDNLKQLQTPYEERINPKKERKAVYPELKENAQKVVSLPKDKQYRSEVKDRKKASEKEVSNEFFAKQAEKFYSRTKAN